MQFLFGIASIIWCLTAPLAPCLKRYFWALLVQGVVGTAAYTLWGNLDPRFFLVYCLLTAPILACVVEISWRSLDTRVYRFRSVAIPFLLALTLCRMAYLDLPKPVNHWNWVALSEAFVLAGAGMILGAAAPYVSNKGTAFVLGLLWVIRAVFDLGYALHFEAWQRLNAYMPTLLCTVAFLLVGAIRRLKGSSDMSCQRKRNLGDHG